MYLYSFSGVQIIFITCRICAVHITLARLAREIIFSDDDVLYAVDRYADSFVKHVALSVPQLPLHFRIFTVSDDTAVKLGHVFKALLQQPAGKFFTAYAACAVREDFCLQACLCALQSSPAAHGTPQYQV